MGTAYVSMVVPTIPQDPMHCPSVVFQKPICSSRCGMGRFPLPTEKKVESETSQSKGRRALNLSNIGDWTDGSG